MGEPEVNRTPEPASEPDRHSPADPTLPLSRGQRIGAAAVGAFGVGWFVVAWRVLDKKMVDAVGETAGAVLLVLVVISVLGAARRR
jgi:hypothetical protein